MADPNKITLVSRKMSKRHEKTRKGTKALASLDIFVTSGASVLSAVAHCWTAMHVLCDRGNSFAPQPTLSLPFAWQVQLS